MKKPVYKYPSFVSKVTLKITNNKRYWLNLVIDELKSENIIVILKNPSKANQEISDKTIYNVSNYIHKNRYKYEELKNIGSIIVLNLIPYFETYSDQLFTSNIEVIDSMNLNIINDFCNENKKVIIAWGNHPKGLYNEYQTLKYSAMDILKNNNNEVYYVDKMTLDKNPKHGQVWGYENILKRLI